MDQQVFPPYYFKQCNTSESLQIPNLDLIMKNTDDFISFGEVHKFADYKQSYLDRLLKEMDELDIDRSIPIKETLTQLNKQILTCCLKITEQIGIGETDLTLTEHLNYLLKKFNKICQVIKFRESYKALLDIYKRELQTIQGCIHELRIKDEEFNQRISKFCTEELL